MGTARGLARVRREALAACMTCPLCRGLLREATAITVCLHTCEFPPLSLSLFPSLATLAVSVPFVRSSYLSAPVSTRAAPRVGARLLAFAYVLRFGVGFLLVLSFRLPRRSGWCPMRVL